MRSNTISISAMFIALFLVAGFVSSASAEAVAGASPLNFKMKDIVGKEVDLSKYKGKVVLMVNVASECGLTPQYKDLVALHKKYSGQGLAILGFPANNFGAQEPGTDKQIQEFCTTRFGVEFDMFSKISVKGDDKHPLYQYLTAGGGNKNLAGEIGWNFEKFLIGRDGQIAARFKPRAKPTSKDVVGMIETQLKTFPPGRKVYMGRRVAHTMHWKGADWLTRTEREREEATSVMIKELKLKPGMVVGDVGCGNGYHTLMMAKRVGEKGKVYGVDIQKEMLGFLMKRAKEKNINNIEPVLGNLIDPNLPEGKLDVILLVDAYHEFSHPEYMLRAMRRALKPNGRLVLVEFRTEDPDVPIKLDHKMSKKQILKELPANGFKLVESYDKLPWQHMMSFSPAPYPAKKTE